MEVLIDEVESLEAILLEDVTVTRNAESGFPEMIETTVLPTVGEEVDRQYVCVTLQVCPKPGYPDVKPTVHLRNPRGLDDSNIDAIRRSINDKLDESIGSPVVFDLIEVIRDHLTQSNLPSGQCVVCLYGFQDGDEFTKTACYHYLHSFCLARHLMASQRNYQEEMDKLPAWQQKLAKIFQPTCPVCRVPIEDDVEPLRQCRPPSELSNAPQFELTAELKSLQAKMSSLFQRQKTRGGIIEVGADESNVISIDDDEPESSVEKLKELTDDPNANAPKMTAQQRVTCRNHRQIQPAAAPKLAEPKKEPKKVVEESDDEAEEEDGRHRRHHHHHDHHRRGGNRHNRRRQYHSSHSQQSQQESSSNGPPSTGSTTR